LPYIPQLKSLQFGTRGDPQLIRDRNLLRKGALKMGINRRLVGLSAATVLAAVYGAPTLANVQVWDFKSSNQSFNHSNNGNSLSMTSSDGVNLTVTAWSDTDDLSGADEVETAELIWAQSSALGIVNRDESSGSPHHSIDSVTSDSDGEFDMLLLEFDTAVNLTSLNLDWATGGSYNNTTDISILAWNGSGSGSVLGETWSGVLDNSVGYDSAGNYSNVGLSYYSVNPTNIESTKWLVGVYNPVFGSGGDAGDDGMKLSKIKTSTSAGPDPQPPGQVPVPGTAALILAGLFGLRGRRKGKVSAQ
jgi:MYXO-CTERM domain-containing protein